MLAPMHRNDRLQPLRAAAILAAAMLLSVALAAASGAPGQTGCGGPCAALRCVMTSRASVQTPATDDSGTGMHLTVGAGREACGSIACVSAPAGWRTLDLPPPAR